MSNAEEQSKLIAVDALPPLKAFRKAQADVREALDVTRPFYEALSVTGLFREQIGRSTISAIAEMERLWLMLDGLNANFAEFWRQACAALPPENVKERPEEKP